MRDLWDLGEHEFRNVAYQRVKRQYDPNYPLAVDRKLLRIVNQFAELPRFESRVGCYCPNTHVVTSLEKVSTWHQDDQSIVYGILPFYMLLWTSNNGTWLRRLHGTTVYELAPRHLYLFSNSHWQHRTPPLTLQERSNRFLVRGYFADEELNNPLDLSEATV